MLEMWLAAQATMLFVMLVGGLSKKQYVFSAFHCFSHKPVCFLASLWLVREAIGLFACRVACCSSLWACSDAFYPACISSHTASCLSVLAVAFQKNLRDKFLMIFVNKIFVVCWIAGCFCWLDILLSGIPVKNSNVYVQLIVYCQNSSLQILITTLQ